MPLRLVCSGCCRLTVVRFAESISFCCGGGLLWPVVREEGGRLKGGCSHDSANESTTCLMQTSVTALSRHKATHHLRRSTDSGVATFHSRCRIVQSAQLFGVAIDRVPDERVLTLGPEKNSRQIQRIGVRDLECVLRVLMRTAYRPQKFHGFWRGELLS